MIVHRTRFSAQIFGPVMQILKFKTVEEVIERANDTEYGLAASVFSKDLDKAIVVSNGLRAGSVWVNTYDNFDPVAPFGGFNQSGLGREKSEYALDSYSETKCVRTSHMHERSFHESERLLFSR